MQNAIRSLSERCFFSVTFALEICYVFFKTNYLCNCYKPSSHIDFNKKENISNFAPACKELPNVLIMKKKMFLLSILNRVQLKRNDPEYNLG